MKLFPAHLKIMRALFRKDILWITLASIFVVLMRVVRPIAHFRLGALLNCDRIGHLATEADIIIAQRLWKVKQGQYIDLYYSSLKNIGENKNPANIYIYNILKKKIPGFKFSKLLAYIDYISKKFKDGAEYTIDTKEAYFDKDILTPRSPPFIHISSKDQKKAKIKLEDLGINLKKPLILFSNRDPAYLSHTFRPMAEETHSFRNSFIDTFIPMAKEFSQLGYTCIRMGKITEKKIHLQDKNIIDFSLYPYDELLELFLFSQSKICIADSTGINILPSIFRKPRVLVNTIPLLTFYKDGYYQDYFNSIIIFKKYLCLRKNRILHSSEIIERGLEHISNSQDFQKEKVKIINNDAEEISKVAKEMKMRLDGEWTFTDKEFSLQSRFWKHIGVKRCSTLENFYPKVGFDFLKNNEWLLK